MVDIAPPKGRVYTPLADVYDGPAIRLSSLVVHSNSNMSTYPYPINPPQRRPSEVERLNKLNQDLGNILNCHRLSKNPTQLQKQMKKQFFNNAFYNNKRQGAHKAQQYRTIYRPAINTQCINTQYDSSVYSEKYSTGKIRVEKSIKKIYIYILMYSMVGTVLCVPCDMPCVYAIFFSFI